MLHLINKQGNGILYTIEEISQLSKPNFKVPIVEFDEYQKECFDRADNKIFKDRINVINPILSSFPLSAHGFLLAGSAVNSLLLHSSYTLRVNLSLIGKYDLYLSNHDEKSALVSINILGNHILKHSGHVNVIRTRNTIVFQCQDLIRSEELIFRIHLHIYPSVYEILNSFDIGADAIGWDNNRLYLVKSSKFAIEFGANILNLETRQSRYEERLVGFYDKGFSIILPNLNIVNISKLSHLKFTDLHQSSKFILNASKIQTYGPNRTKEEESIYYDEESVFKHNMAINCNTELIAYKAYHIDLPIQNIQPIFDIKVLKIIINRIFNRDHILDGCCKLSQFLGNTRAAEILLECIETHKKPTAEKINTVCTSRIDELNNQILSIPLDFENPKRIESTTKENWYGRAYKI